MIFIREFRIKGALFAVKIFVETREKVKIDYGQDRGWQTMCPQAKFNPVPNNIWLCLCHNTELNSGNRDYNMG